MISSSAIGEEDSRIYSVDIDLAPQLGAGSNAIIDELVNLKLDAPEWSSLDENAERAIVSALQTLRGLEALRLQFSNNEEHDIIWLMLGKVPQQSEGVLHLCAPLLRFSYSRYIWYIRANVDVMTGSGGWLSLAQHFVKVQRAGGLAFEAYMRLMTEIVPLFEGLGTILRASLLEYQRLVNRELPVQHCTKDLIDFHVDGMLRIGASFMELYPLNDASSHRSITIGELEVREAQVHFLSNIKHTMMLPSWRLPLLLCSYN
ncbi:hypothetical protein F5B18DRAFT_181265 [Nemania serpens]|nr:hypothetical protein F5B18DRAFT_181265 [Nemania serpens]